jgi:hypothetical protein
MKEFAVVLVSPEGRQNSFLRWVAEQVDDGLKRLGHVSGLILLDVARGPHFGDEKRRCIVLGVHLLHKFPPLDIPKGAIIYNSAEGGSEDFARALPHLQVSGRTVWDFSRANVEMLRGIGIRSTFVPPGCEDDVLERALGPTPNANGPTLCLIVMGKDTEAFEKMDFLDVAKREVDELILIKTKDARFGGMGAVFNRVLDRTLCEIVGTVHTDTTFAPGSLTTFAKTAAAGKVTGIVGRALGCNPFGGDIGGDKGWYTWSKGVSSETEIGCLDGCSLFIRRDSGLRFDEETFPHFHCGIEDVCMQARAKGIPIVVPACYAHHHSGETGTYLEPTWQKVYWETRKRLAAKWPGWE